MGYCEICEMEHREVYPLVSVTPKRGKLPNGMVCETHFREITGEDPPTPTEEIHEKPLTHKLLEKLNNEDIILGGVMFVTLALLLLTIIMFGISVLFDSLATNVLSIKPVFL